MDIIVSFLRVGQSNYMNNENVNIMNGNNRN